MSRAPLMIGDSPAMQAVHARIEQVAATRSTLLILGETGTGKELVARAVHQLSDRHARPLVAVNCTALPDKLVESELLGHERGAFTGADRSKQGVVELADGGTLFLDEIGDLEHALQGKLLRVIEERRFRRVGGVRDLDVDVRFIAATNRDLEQQVADGRFRSDLFYRLNVFPIWVPPLRERGTDVLLLARHFIGQFNQQLGKNIRTLDEQAERLLLEHAFPGNVRQLRNLVEQAMILAPGERLTADHLRGQREGAPTTAASRGAGQLRPTPLSLDQQLGALRRREQELIAEERRIIGQAIQDSRGNKSRAASVLGVSRYALLRRLRRFEEPAKA